MNLRRALSYAGIGIGAAAATDTLLRNKAGDLPPALDGLQRTYRWRGMDVAYTEAGDADDPDLVLLHGLNAAGSSGEWREVFDVLSEEYHVVAPDLPGYGRSDRPRFGTPQRSTRSSSRISSQSSAAAMTTATSRCSPPR